jgi:uncharacterized protein YbjT (DUF2867 family)
MRVMVAGASGETGRRVVAALVERGHHVRALVRRPARFDPRVEVVTGDVRDRASLDRPAGDMDACISALGTRRYYGDDGGRAVDGEGTRSLVDALVRARVRRLVLVSAFGLDRASPFLSAFSCVFGEYYRWKAEAERAVRESGLDYTIVRPVELTNRTPRGHAWLNQSEPLSLLRTVSRDVVARVVVTSLEAPEANRKTFEVFEAPGRAPPVEIQLNAMQVDGAWRPAPRTPLLARAADQRAGMPSTK